MPRAPLAGVVPPEEIDEHILKLRNELKPQLKKEKKKKQKKKKKKEKKQGSIENADESKDSVYETDEQSKTDEESCSWTPSDCDENEWDKKNSSTIAALQKVKWPSIIVTSLGKIQVFLNTTNFPFYLLQDFQIWDKKTLQNILPQKKI